MPEVSKHFADDASGSSTRKLCAAEPWKQKAVQSKTSGDKPSLSGAASAANKRKLDSAEEGSDGEYLPELPASKRSGGRQANSQNKSYIRSETEDPGVKTVVRHTPATPAPSIQAIANLLSASKTGEKQTSLMSPFTHSKTAGDKTAGEKYSPEGKTKNRTQNEIES